MFAVERPANIKDNPSVNDKLAKCGGKKTIYDNNCPKGLGLFLFGLSPKRNKKNILCALWVSSGLSGRLVPSSCGVEAFRRGPKLAERSLKRAVNPYLKTYELLNPTTKLISIIT